MKYVSKVNASGLADWEYDALKKQEKKRTKRTRQIRRNKHDIWG